MLELELLEVVSVCDFEVLVLLLMLKKLVHGLMILNLPIIIVRIICPGVILRLGIRIGV